jgi:poly(hydroxyalkanoate) depolymerase family esterase
VQRSKTTSQQSAFPRLFEGINMRRFPDIFSSPAIGSRTGQAGRASQLLEPLADFGHNPGQLVAKTYLPETLSPGAPLVVVLHGCTQTAGQYDLGAGWSTVADEHGFALLFPEQQRTNNPNLCFNWFLPQDSRRERGEALSIRNMILAMVERHRLDPDRVFVTGLSAGGAMANVLLSTYPELFAGGAIIAGLPYGTASDVPQALERMRGQGLPGEPALGALVRRASDHDGPWPAVSVWHGGADATVHPSNADAIVSQWRSVHGLAEAPARTDMVDGFPRRAWIDGQGRECVTSYTITGMAHGTPLATSGPDACGKAGPYMLDKHISSTRHICRSWGLSDQSAGRAGADQGDELQAARVPRSLALAHRPDAFAEAGEPTAPLAGPSAGVGKVIEDALRAAGLMR